MYVWTAAMPCIQYGMNSSRNDCRNICIQEYIYAYRIHKYKNTGHCRCCIHTYITHTTYMHTYIHTYKHIYISTAMTRHDVSRCFWTPGRAARTPPQPSRSWSTLGRWCLRYINTTQRTTLDGHLLPSPFFLFLSLSLFLYLFIPTCFFGSVSLPLSLSVSFLSCFYPNAQELYPTHA